MGSDFNRYSTALYRGVVELLNQLWNFFKRGPVHMLTWKDYSKRPSVLDDLDFGEHSFVDLEVCRDSLHELMG